MDSIPRRNRVNQYTPAESAIAAAVQAVEMAGASLHLTKAVNFLQAAQSAVADYVDGVPDNADENEEGYAFVHAALHGGQPPKCCQTGAGGVDPSDVALMDRLFIFPTGSPNNLEKAAWTRLKPFLVAAPQALRYDQMRALDMDGWPDGKLVQLNAKGRYLSAWTPRVYEVVRKSKAAPPSPETPPLGGAK